MREDPLRQSASLLGIVVQRWNHQIRDFEPHFCFVLQPLEGLEDWLQMRQRSFSVETFGESFQVDVRGIDMVVDVVKSLMSDIAVRQMSITYSPQIVGSLYVKARESQPYRNASKGTSSAATG